MITSPWALFLVVFCSFFSAMVRALQVINICSVLLQWPVARLIKKLNVWAGQKKKKKTAHKKLPYLQQYIYGFLFSDWPVKQRPPKLNSHKCGNFLDNFLTPTPPPLHIQYFSFFGQTLQWRDSRRRLSIWKFISVALQDSSVSIQGVRGSWIPARNWSIRLPWRRLWRCGAFKMPS